ncbi:Leucine-rich repeat-containing protein 40 [Escovopsis weberi]|uniref:Leucine-rich repeat-containing protein 40 n=1 Tax=Escovopsis weberi TaxID=150374 RepID=A0A0M9VS25_ESCWE|nr:Leucine-rich repeat-containing protein 40 [Escovopsis weberi]
MNQAGGDDISSVGYETVGLSTRAGFDESAHIDPFNTRKGGNTILKQRVSDARTSGRLNIAALGLKEIPAEVMKMYDFESIQESGGTWSDSVDLKRFIAPDNELEKLDDVMFPDHDPAAVDENADSQNSASIFGGVEAVDLHGNKIVSVPVGLRRLAHLTSLNLSSNRLNNDCLSVIAQISSLRDLKLAKNCLAGPLDVSLADLTLLETLDIHGNHVSALPSEFENLKQLRILSLSDNNFESIAFSSLAKLPLTELDLKRNKLSGTLIEEPIDSLPHLQTFDVSSNRLTRLVPEGVSLDLPVLHTLSVSMNRLQELPDMSSWTNLLTLTADTNNISVIPESFARLLKLRQADFSGNDLKVVPPEVARMEDLTMLRLSGNPLRERKFAAASADAIKAILAGRLEPLRENTAVEASPKSNDDQQHAAECEKQDEGDTSDEDEHFSTPPTSALPSPSEPKDFSSLAPTLQVRSSGLLDNSRTDSATLDAELCARFAAQHKVYHAQLHHNLYVCIPGALSIFAETLTSLALGHNQMVGETYLVEELKLPSLSELNLTSNHITSLGPLTKFLRAPSLEKIDISMNRLSALPPDLKQNFPKMIVLLASNNKLVELDPASIRGLQVVDVSSNDIGHLDPRIGLLGGHSGLQKLEVMGNRFRVPRWNVLERGTEATMRWLRGRVPAADVAAWKAEHGDDGVEDDDELD